MPQLPAADAGGADGRAACCDLSGRHAAVHTGETLKNFLVSKPTLPPLLALIVCRWRSCLMYASGLSDAGVSRLSCELFLNVSPTRSAPQRTKAAA